MMYSIENELSKEYNQETVLGQATKTQKLIN